MKQLFPMRFKFPKRKKRSKAPKSPLFSKKNPLQWTGILLIFLITIFNIAWKKHPVVLLLNEQITTKRLSKHIDKHLYLLKNDKKHKYLQYQIGADTLIIRFTKDKIITLSNYEYSSPRYGWNLGYLSYKDSKNNWKQLHDKFGVNNNFIVPIVANRRTMRDLEHQLYNKILPASLRQDNEGNSTQIIKKWD